MRCACCDTELKAHECKWDAQAKTHADLCRKCKDHVTNTLRDEEGYPELVPKNYVWPSKRILPDD